MAKPHEQIRRLRAERGMSQAELARRSGISRQALGAIEAGIYQPSVSVALSLAREFDETVENLFGEIDEPRCCKVTADWPRKEVLSKDQTLCRVALARVGGRVVAVPQRTPSLALLPAAGTAAPLGRKRVAVSTFHSPDEVDATLLLAGCDPAVAILIGWMARSGSRISVVALPCSSGSALTALADGSVHVAGVHLRDPKSGDYNFASVQRAIGRRRIHLINFARWELGLVINEGNPRAIRNFVDLARSGVRIVNRERGSGARQVLDEAFAEASVNPAAVAGYRDEVSGHLEVAAAVREGRADAGVTIRVAAQTYGLGFIALREERYDLAIPDSELESMPVKRMLEALNSRRFSSEVAQLCAYDTGQMGEELARIEA